MSKKEKRVNAALSQREFDDVQKAADDNFTSISQIIRWALRKYLSKN